MISVVYVCFVPGFAYWLVLPYAWHERDNPLRSGPTANGIIAEWVHPDLSLLAVNGFCIPADPCSPYRCLIPLELLWEKGEVLTLCFARVLAFRVWSWFLYFCDIFGFWIWFWFYNLWFLWRCRFMAGCRTNLDCFSGCFSLASFVHACKLTCFPLSVDHLLMINGTNPTCSEMVPVAVLWRK